MHLEDNMEEYVGCFDKQNFDIVDLIFIKTYCKEIDMLKQNGYWSTNNHFCLWLLQTGVNDLCESTQVSKMNQ